MALRVELQDACEGANRPDDVLLGHWAEAALLDEREAEVVIRIVDEAESEALNARYRGKARPTNVLSFPFEAPTEIVSELLGDVLICAPVVAREARSQGKTPHSHWAHMVVHGMLHLQGHDHVEPEAAEVMEALERDILAGLGFADPYAELEGAKA